MPEARERELDPVLYQPPAHRRVWWWVIRIGAAVLVALVCCVGWLLLDSDLSARHGAVELAAAQARVEAGAPDWTWERLNEARVRPPAAQNGAPLIPKIKKLTHPGWEKSCYDPILTSRLDIPPNVRYAPEVIAHFRRDLDESADAVRPARTLKDRPFGHRDIELSRDVFSTWDQRDTKDTRGLAELLRWDVGVACEDGDVRRTADDLLALLNASRSIGDEPILISQLVRMSIRTIAVRGAERAVAQRADLPLGELQAALAADADEPLLLYGLRGERALYDRVLGNLQTGATDLTELPREGLGGRLGFWGNLGWQRYRAHLRAERADLLLWLTRHVDAARRPVHEQPALVAAIPELPNDGRHILSRHYTSGSIETFARKSWRTTAEARCAVVGLACERFRQKHNRWPEALTELVPEFLPAVPLDPFEGEPLRYLKLDDGVVVFSVGKHPMSGYERHGLPGGIDYGFRLWNTDRRRLPPLPVPNEPPDEAKP